MIFGTFTNNKFGSNSDLFSIGLDRKICRIANNALSLRKNVDKNSDPLVISYFQGQAHHMFSLFLNLRIFSTKISLLCFPTRQKFSIEIKNTNITEKDTLQPYKKLKHKISWKEIVDSGFVKNMSWTHFKILFWLEVKIAKLDFSTRKLYCVEEFWLYQDYHW